MFNKNLEKTFIYKRGKELESKMEKEPVETKQEPVVEEVKEEEPVLEEVKEKEPVLEEVEEQEPVLEEVEEQEPVLEEIKNEKPVEEELKPEGFISKVRGFFGRFKKKK